MKNKASKSINKFYKYSLWILVGFIGVLTGYYTFKIVEYFIKPVDNPLMPLGFYKYIGFPYISFIPFLLVILFLGIYFIRKEFYQKGSVIFYLVLVLVFHLMQKSLFDLFNGFNPYAG